MLDEAGRPIVSNSGAPSPGSHPARRVRLRPTPDAAALAAMYAARYQHTRWADHVQRVEATVAFAMAALPERPTSIADLSTGDGAIPTGIADAWVQGGYPRPELTLGDVTPGWPLCGPIERTLLGVGADGVDLLVCSETVEHLDDPDVTLATASVFARWLLLTTPADEWDPGHNPEHLWGWNVAALAELLSATGWTPVAHTVYTPSAVPFYTFQLWIARSWAFETGEPVRAGAST